MGRCCGCRTIRRKRPCPVTNPWPASCATCSKNEELQPYAQFLTPDWDNAAWIGNRLAEILPLPLQIRQALLEMTEPRERLDILLALFQEQRLA